MGYTGCIYSKKTRIGKGPANYKMPLIYLNINENTFKNEGRLNLKGTS